MRVICITTLWSSPATPTDVGLMGIRWVLLLLILIVAFVVRRRSLTVWIVVSLALGAEIGHDFPEASQHLGFLSKIFLNLVKTIVAPLIFATLVMGIAGHSKLKQVGRIAVKALVYFEVVTTIALFIGLVAINLTKAGRGVRQENVKAERLMVTHPSGTDAILHLFPENIIKSVAEGEILPIVIFSVIFAIALAQLPEANKRPMLSFVASLSDTMFKFTDMVMYFSPVGVGAAMAHTVGTAGLGVLRNVFALLLSFYGAIVIFVLCILLPIAVALGIRLKRFAQAVVEPVSIGFATSSSEAALPRAMEAMEGLGISRQTVAFVMSTGYTFNLAGSALYLSLATVFVAQAAEIPLSLERQFSIVFALVLSSKGLAGVPRASLIVLMATAASFGLPEWPILMLLGVDTLLDMPRTAVNVMGNCLATAVIAKWEGEFSD